MFQKIKTRFYLDLRGIGIVSIFVSIYLCLFFVKSIQPFFIGASILILSGSLRNVFLLFCGLHGAYSLIESIITTPYFASMTLKSVYICREGTESLSSLFSSKQGLTINPTIQQILSFIFIGLFCYLLVKYIKTIFQNIFFITVYLLLIYLPPIITIYSVYFLFYSSKFSLDELIVLVTTGSEKIQGFLTGVLILNEIIFMFLLPLSSYLILRRLKFKEKLVRMLPYLEIDR